MKKGQILEGTVSRVDFPNKGMVCTKEGEVCVKDTLPGQEVQCSIIKTRGEYPEGRLLKTQKPSPLEKRESACEIFPACGGCTWQKMTYEDQLSLKEGQVRRLLEPVLNKCPGAPSWEQVYEGIRKSPREFAYRNKMEFSFGDEVKDGPLCLGLHRRGSLYDVLTAADCRLVHPDMTKVLSAVLAFFRERGIPYYHKTTREGVLRHLLLRRSESSGQLLICLVTTGVEDPGILQDFTKCLLQLDLEGSIAGILHMRNTSVADVVKSEETTVLYGENFFYETLLGLRFRITPFSFFQTNSLGAEVLYSTAREMIKDTEAEVLFDLYSGTGTIAQILSPMARTVIGVEIVEEAVEAARLNAQGNGLANCTFLAGDVLKVLDEIRERPDLIVLDPPRDGVHPKVLPKIIAYGAPQILYISCKPTSLARDLAVFESGGYLAERICCVDLFPQTANTETVCLLSENREKRGI